MKDDTFVDIIIFILAAIIGIAKTLYEWLHKKQAEQKTLPEYSPYEEPLKRRRPVESNPYDDFPDETEIEGLIFEYADSAKIPLIKSNRGVIMKVVAANLKGKADMSIVSKVVGGMLR